MVICFYWSGVGEENDQESVVEASNGTTPATIKLVHLCYC
jgi:hypothetical protein